MISAIKSGLLALLGQRRYLQLISQIFFVSYKIGWLKNNPAYFTHYRAMEWIHAGDTIIDIGANLGYYSVLFAKKTGRSGKVYSVEPIPVYQEVLKKNTNKLPQITVLPYALGVEEGILRMGNPSLEKHRHGLMHVLNENENAAVEYRVPVKNPALLFAFLNKIDYIKCDIEGYEIPVIPTMLPILQKHRPIVQVETQGANKEILLSLFQQLDYKTFYATGLGLQAYTNAENLLPGDLIAIPNEKWKM